VKVRIPASTHKKVVVRFLDRKVLRGYLNPNKLGAAEALELLTQRQARVLGLVVNGADASAHSYYYYKNVEYYQTAKRAGPSG